MPPMNEIGYIKQLCIVACRKEINVYKYTINSVIIRLQCSGFQNYTTLTVLMKLSQHLFSCCKFT